MFQSGKNTVTSAAFMHIATKAVCGDTLCFTLHSNDKTFSVRYAISDAHCFLVSQLPFNRLSFFFFLSAGFSEG